MMDFECLWYSYFSDNDPVRRVKVAILDSGIQYDHEDFLDQSTRKRIVEEPESWVDDQPKTDSYGHGTHIAGTMLRLTENIDLCIAKITQEGKFQDLNAVTKVCALPTNLSFAVAPGTSMYPS